MCTCACRIAPWARPVLAQADLPVGNRTAVHAGAASLRLTRCQARCRLSRPSISRSRSARPGSVSACPAGRASPPRRPPAASARSCVFCPERPDFCRTTLPGNRELDPLPRSALRPVPATPAAPPAFSLQFAPVILSGAKRDLPGQECTASLHDRRIHATDPWPPALRSHRPARPDRHRLVSGSSPSARNCDSRFLSTVGHPAAVKLHFARCGQLT